VLLKFFAEDAAIEVFKLEPREAHRARLPRLFNRFILFVVSSSRDHVGRALLEMKHACDA
jgi:hypothetical protein